MKAAKAQELHAYAAGQGQAGVDLAVLRRQTAFDET